ACSTRRLRVASRLASATQGAYSRWGGKERAGEGGPGPRGGGPGGRPGRGGGGRGGGEVGRRVDGPGLVVGLQLDDHGVAGRDPGGLAQGPVDGQVGTAAVGGHRAAGRLAVCGGPDPGA